MDRYGRLDVLVSNAGISGEVSEIVAYPSAVFARTLAVHVLKHRIPHVHPRCVPPASHATRPPRPSTG
jgi:NAD(P)-dependent dehydrogenase (short-subunit alcohol dehydrogenase family)